MKCVEIINELEVLRGINSLSASNKLDIEIMYHDVLGKNLMKSSCNDCYHDAIIEIYLYLKKYGKMKEKSNYTLKNGVLLQPGFGSGNMYTNDNLTDEVAEKYLAQYPNGIILFAATPTDWEERVEKRMNPGDTLNTDLVSELVKALQIEGTTIRIVKETFKSYQIDGKKVTGKVLDAHIKEAQSIIDATLSGKADLSGDNPDDKKE